MNPHSNFNYPIFNNYYQDPRVSYPAYAQPYEPNMFDEAENQDYTFLPKANTFFDHFIGSPLDVTRQSTDVTETHENVPHFGPKSISPNSITYQKYNIQDYNSKFCNLNAKSAELPVKNKFIAVLGASTGITYNGYNVCVEPRDFSSQPTSASITSQPFNAEIIKKEEHVEKQKIVEKPERKELEEEEDEQHTSHEVILNVQLKSLLEAKIWSSEKDQMLLKLGTQYKCDWKKISKRFNNKKVTPHFLKIRYKELTCAPLQRRVKFNHKEDLMIAKYFEKYGSNWAQMATHFHNRTAIMLKNRYYSFIRKRELLDGLLKKVIEIERDDSRVDDLKDQETETCYDMFTSQKGGSNDDSEHVSTSQGADVEKSVSNDASESPNEHPIFGFEKVPQILHPAPTVFVSKEAEGMKVERAQARNMMTEVEPQGNGNKEVDVLKARIKSLQTLYLRTKSELDQYKQKY